MIFEIHEVNIDKGMKYQHNLIPRKDVLLLTK